MSRGRAQKSGGREHGGGRVLRGLGSRHGDPDREILMVMYEKSANIYCFLIRCSAARLGASRRGMVARPKVIVS